MRGMKWHHLGKKITEKYPKGQGMVEFALILPLLLVLMFGVIELGRMIFVYSAVYTASREAARYGSAAGSGIGGLPRYADHPGIEAAALRIGTLANVTVENIGYDTGGTKNLEGALTLPSAVPNPVVGGKHRIVVVVSADYRPVVPLVNIPATTISSWSARTILNNLSVGVHPLPGLHVGDLDGISINGSAGWTARITVFVHDDDENLISGATVHFSHTQLKKNEEPPSCTTGESGTCQVDIIKLKETENIITVLSITHPTIVSYDDGSNHDPDMDSDGTSISLSEPPP